MGLGWFCKQLRAEKIMLDLVPRRLMCVAEQLLGAGTLVEPDESPAPDGAPKKSDNGVGIGQHVRGVINVMPELPDAPRVAAAGAATRPPVLPGRCGLPLRRAAEICHAAALLAVVLVLTGLLLRAPTWLAYQYVGGTWR